MNDKVREFVSQSHLDVYGLGKDREKWEATVEKFVDMIVEECIMVLGLSDTFETALLKHFGGK